MKTPLFQLVVVCFTSLAIKASAAVLYVDLNCTNPVSPYADWSTAATNIQDAIDASTNGDTVLVTNGVYQTGGRVVYGSLTNRVAVTKRVTVQSLNGPAATIIQGYQAPTVIVGDDAVRCVYLADGSVLTGFTLTNGATRSYDSDAGYEDLVGAGVWCESPGAVVTNCVLTGNFAADSGGGAYGGTLNNCLFSSNTADYGGGAYGGTLNNCVLTDNSAYDGGGTHQGTLTNCTLTGNSARWGGGGGAYDSALINCTLTGNSADYGGGAGNSTLINCTVVGNSASHYGGGACSGTLNNCIVYYNTVYYNDTAPSGTNYFDSSLNYCCTAPLPSEGEGNITNDPQLASLSHISAGSPCRAAGSATYASGVDIDGETWANPPSIGCDEYHAGAVTGPLAVASQATYTLLATGIEDDFKAVIDGCVSASQWEFDDGTVVSNQPYAMRIWTAPGDYPVMLRAYNETYPAGVIARVIVQVRVQPLHYVALSSPNPVAPYGSWATAATNIQDAVNVASPNALILVSNGVYLTGSQMVVETVRVGVTKVLGVQSVNGPAVTTIDGEGVMGCVYLTGGAVLAGFTLTNGVTEVYGAGVSCDSVSAVVSNCMLTGNWAAQGGGAYSGTLNNCTLTGNSASFYGGGARDSTLNNCTLTGNSASRGGGASHSTLNNCTLNTNTATYGGGAYSNTLNNCTLNGNSATIGGGACSSTLNNCTIFGNSASYGGGAYQGALKNCIVYYNTAPNGSNYNGGALNYCCTMPRPSGGTGNITNAPLFVNFAGGNLRPQTNSFCINAGNNTYAVGSTDMDGRPRIVGGTVDMGAYEFQGAGMGEFIGWLQLHGLPADGSADCVDSDSDGMNNWQEWRTGTIPTDSSSLLQMMSPTLTTDPSGVIVTWQSIEGVTYFLQRSTNLGTQSAFSIIQNNIAGQVGTTSYTDTNTVGAGPFFYRVGVQ
jgi:hypothetical protein